MTTRVRGARHASAGGFVTVEHVLAVGLALVLLVALTNLVLVQYARGVVRTALDDGVRAGSRTIDSRAAAVAVCRDVAERTHRDLLPGRLGDRIEVSCRSEADAVVARADAAFPAWLPGVSAWHTTDRARAVWEGTR